MALYQLLVRELSLSQMKPGHDLIYFIRSHVKGENKKLKDHYFKLMPFCFDYLTSF